MGAILNYTPKREAEISKSGHPLVSWQVAKCSKKELSSRPKLSLIKHPGFTTMAVAVKPGSVSRRIFSVQRNSISMALNYNTSHWRADMACLLFVKAGEFCLSLCLVWVFITFYLCYSSLWTSLSDGLYNIYSILQDKTKWFHLKHHLPHAIHDSPLLRNLYCPPLVQGANTIQFNLALDWLHFMSQLITKASGSCCLQIHPDHIDIQT